MTVWRKKDMVKVYCYAWTCMADTGTGSLVFTDDVTAESRIHFEVYRYYVFAQIVPNPSKHIARHFTLQQDNDPKHGNGKSIAWLESNTCFTRWRQGKNPLEQTGYWIETEDGYSTSLAEHHQGRYPASVDVYGSQTSGSHWMKIICNQVLNMINLLALCWYVHSFLL